MEFEAVIGLEVHAQLKTASKIFCGCSTAFGALPNANACPVCAGMPGTLPVLNKKVVEFAMRMAIASGCEIKRESRFARKNYFYPDLPKSYQISQYELPIAVNGRMDIESMGQAKRIGITRIHMEEDAGKLTHARDAAESMVDFNRTGIPLIEIVSEPDIRTPEEAGAYLRKMRNILRYLDICDGSMEEGSLRCDANVSVMPKDSDSFGTRVELKNLNSFKYLEKAVSYEIERQKQVLLDEQKVIQETRLWDSGKNMTTSMRAKEEAHDYRYFPDPDLTPIHIDEEWIEAVKKTVCELPDEKKRRFVTEHKLSDYNAEILISDPDLAKYYEECLKYFFNPRETANWIIGPLTALFNSPGADIRTPAVSPRDMADLLILIDDGAISGKAAKTALEEMFKTGKPPKKIVEEKGLRQVTDEDAIEKVVLKIISNFPEEAEKYKSGKKKLLSFFVGQAMKETKGKADPKMASELVKRHLMARL